MFLDLKIKMVGKMSEEYFESDEKFEEYLTARAGNFVDMMEQIILTKHKLNGGKEVVNTATA